jgi:signal transduction histidine kinase
VTLPLLVGDRLIGVLNLNDKIDYPYPFDDVDVVFLRVAAEHLASALAVRQQTARLTAALGALRHTQQRLVQSERLAAVTKLIAGIAHELKNPLTSLHLAAVNIETALRRRDLLEGDARLGGFVRSLHQDIDRIQGKVESFLSFARPELGVRRPQELRPLVQQVLAQMHDRLSAHRITLRQDLVADLPSLEIDDRAFGEALANLVVNAIEAMPHGGDLAVVLRRQGPFAAVEVADSGPGISEPVRPHVFDLFFTTKAKGSGIGLSQVHMFCDTHGGRIELETEPGRTLFRMLLPASGRGAP